MRMNIAAVNPTSYQSAFGSRGEQLQVSFVESREEMAWAAAVAAASATEAAEAYFAPFTTANARAGTGTVYGTPTDPRQTAWERMKADAAAAADYVRRSNATPTATKERTPRNYGRIAKRFGAAVLAAAAGTALFLGVKTISDRAEQRAADGFSQATAEGTFAPEADCWALVKDEDQRKLRVTAITPFISSAMDAINSDYDTWQTDRAVNQTGSQMESLILTDRDGDTQPVKEVNTQTANNAGSLDLTATHIVSLKPNMDGPFTVSIVGSPLEVYANGVDAASTGSYLPVSPCDTTPLG